jgi:hypothetical protein
MNIDLLNNSAVGRDFLSFYGKKMKQPSVDQFLDYRLAVMSRMENDKTVPKQWYVEEIAAVDEILKILNEAAVCDGSQEI